eukprot:gene24319-32756_t
MGAKEVKYFTAVSAMGVRNCCYRWRPPPGPGPGPGRGSEDGKDASDRDRDAAASSSSVSASASASSSFSVALILVGRTDGTVDLFRSDCEGPLQSWSLSSPSSSSWVAHRPAAFLAADSSGRLFLFDLLQDVGGPVGSEQLSTETKLSAQMLDISGGRPSSSSSSSFSYRREALPLHIAVASGGAAGPFVRRLNRPAGASGGKGGGGGDEAGEEQAEAEEERMLIDAISRYASKTAMEQFVTTLPRARDHHLK